MADNDPYFDLRFLELGSSGAEQIFNEWLARAQTAFGYVKSRTIATPPGSPDTFDAYLVPTGATGDWSALVGDLVVYFNGWVVMEPKQGFNVYIEDEDKYIDWWGSAAPFSITAKDGAQTLVPVDDMGTWRINWDVALGAHAYVLVDPVVHTTTVIMMAPTNMRGGRFYSLRIQNGATGVGVVQLEIDVWATAVGNPLPIAVGNNAITDYLISGEQPFGGATDPVATVLDDFPGIVQASA